LYKPRNKGYKKPTQPGGEVIRVRTPMKADMEILGTATKLLGANHLNVICLDGVTRMCRIKGAMKKRSWIREGDIVIVVPWPFQNAKGDITYRYTRPQADWLKQRGYLKDEDRR